MTEETTAMLTKKGLRASLLARRKQLFESLALDNGLAERFLEMLELARPKSVGLFWPIRSEPGLLSVARDWLKRTGGLIYLPETRPDCMIYRLWHEGAELRKDCAGIPYPQGEEASKPPAMVVAPCVGYAESCRRLGYGGGYFDRYLASYGNQRPLAVGVAFDELRVPEEIFESFDEPFDAVVTERRIILKAKAPL